MSLVDLDRCIDDLLDCVEQARRVRRERMNLYQDAIVDQYFPGWVEFLGHGYRDCPNPWECALHRDFVK